MIDSTVEVSINADNIEDKFTNDELGYFVATEWWRLLNPYVPKRTGMLETAVLKPFQITYTAPYAHYMYTGKVYVDPVYHASGFTKDGGITWFSRKGVKKIPTDRSFNYRKDPNPYATDHWDKAAAESGQADKLVTTIEKYIERESRG